MVKDPIFF